MKKTRNRKLLSLLVTVMLLLNIFMTSMPAFADTPVTIAAWNFTSSPASAVIPATGGVLSAGATLTNSMGNKPSYTASNSTIYTNGWNDGENAKYWEFSVSTTGYSELAFTASAYSTSTGPRDFKISYSIDNGVSWNDVDGSSRTLTSALPGTPTWNAVALPIDAADQEHLLLRLIMTSNTSVSGGTVAETGNSRLAAIGLTGIAGTGGGGGKVAEVTATPSGGAVASGATVTLSTQTDNATVYYSVYSPYPILQSSGIYSDPIQLNFDQAATPITLKAYATADGLDDSDVSTWIFTQAKLNKVTASPPSGEVAVGTEVTLSAASGATIYYTTDGNTPDTDSTPYSGAITISSLPFTIKAIAVQAGYLPSDVATFTYTLQQAYDLDGETGIAAEWVLSSVSSTPIPATGGDFKAASELSCWFGSTSQTLSYSSGGASCSGWNGGSTKPDYWLVKTSTKGMANLHLAWRMRSSNTGPRDFKVQYSTDNATWTDIPDPTMAIKAGALAITADDSLFTKTLPSGAANQDTLYLRWLMASETSASGGTVASGGTHQINNISITGAYIIGANQVYAVSADIPSGAVALGSTVTFSSQTADATIKYSTDGGTSYITAANGQITLETLPATLYVKAVKEGMDDSRVKTFSYTQAQTANVIASPAGGEVQLNDVVKLTCATTGATIYYSWLQNPGAGDFAQYDPNTPLTLPTLPANLTVYATAPGCIDGQRSSYYFTQALDPSLYNIYFGQLHAHTNLSDGIGEVEDAFSYARNNAKVDFLAITDHSNMFDNDLNYTLGGLISGKDPDKDFSGRWQRGHAAADAITTDGEFVGLYGFEMTWSASTGFFGHINTFNTPGFETRNNTYFTTNSPDASLNGLKRYYDRLTEVPGSLSQLNHPGTTFGDFLDFAFYDPKYDSFVKLVEVGNGEGPINSSGYFPSYEYYTRALDKGWHVAPTNNQDNHLGKWGDANTGRTVVLAQALTRNDIYDAISNRRVYATEDNNLKIRYTVNGHPMGYIYPDDNAPTEPMNFSVNLNDPDGNLSGGTVSVIVNGGYVAASTAIRTDASAGAVLTRSESGDDFTWDFQLPPNYSYYYIQVIEPNGLKAVTAPVWIGTVQKVGINKTTIDTTLPVKGEAATVTTTFYNNETTNLVINSITYSVGGQTVMHDNSPNITVAPGGTGQYTFSFTPTKLGQYNLDVRVNATFNGTSKVFRDVLKLEVADPDTLTTIAVDAAHYNDYIAGNYANYIGAFTKVAVANAVRVKLVTGPITTEALKDSQGNYVAALVLTPPARKSGTYTPKDGSPAVNYTPSLYSESELAAIAQYAQSGGNFIICGNSSYNDVSGTTYKVSTQMNNVLAAIGATTRMNADEAFDDDNNLRQTNYRLAFPYDRHNLASPFTKGVRETQVYSFYGGCTLNIDSSAVENGTVQAIVYGHETTYGSSDLTTSPPKPAESITVQKGDMIALVSERLPNGGTAIIGGTVYISDFEIPDFDPTNSLTNSNMQIIWNVLKTLKKPVPLVDIAVVRGAENGKIYSVEGIVTSCSVGYNPANAFFDTIYVQDDTGGLDIFGIASKAIQVGQKVRITGTVGEYLGDKELVLSSEDDVQIIDATLNPLAPRDFSTTDAMKPENGGWLGRVTGTVTRVDTDNQGLIQAIFVKDANDKSQYGARLFIDGYIGYSNSNSPKLEDFVKVGTRIKGVGLLSTDTEGQRLRVRDRSEIIRVTGSSSNPHRGTTTEPTPPTQVDVTTNTTGGTTTVTGIVTTATDASGKAAATVTASQVNAILNAVNSTAAGIGVAVQISVAADTSASRVEVNIPQDLFSRIADSKSEAIQIASGLGSVTFDQAALDTIKATGTGAIQISMAKVEASTLAEKIRDAVGSRPVYNFGVLCGTTAIVDFGGNVTVRIPYTPAQDEDLNAIVIYYIGQDGELKLVNISGYDQATGYVSFVTTHFSTYTVGYNKLNYKDTANSWAKDSITYLAARNIISGVGNGNFAPNEGVTRAQFARMLAGILGVDASNLTGSRFSDVSVQKWYAPYVEWAAENDIVAGKGNGKFEPDAPETREQMAVMITNFARTAKYTLPGKTGTSNFADQEQISSWAVEAVAAVKTAGIISGKPGNKFDPQAYATRAEAASMLTVLLKGMVQ